jgi:hypothetical protein
MAQDGALIVLDGQKLGTDASALTSINPNDIEDIRILVDPSEIVMYTGLNSVGIIEIKSKHGGSSAKTEETTDTVVKDGALKSFTPEAIGEKKYDLKTTLQWIPGLLTDGNGEAIVSFKTGAIKSSFTLEIAGFTDQRRWIQAQTEIRIK